MAPARTAEKALAVLAREAQENRMTRPLLALLVALLAGACAAHRTTSSQQKAASAATPQAATGKAAAPLVLCRPERPTGSNIMTRVCYSEDDLGALDPAAQETLRRAQQQGSYQPIRN
jgi:hypothetical protein